jgi:hypothetical protein
MHIQQLISKFKGCVDKTNSGVFIRLVKVLANFDKERSWLTPHAQLPPQKLIDAAYAPPKTAGKAASK